MNVYKSIISTIALAMLVAGCNKGLATDPVSSDNASVEIVTDTDTGQDSLMTDFLIGHSLSIMREGAAQGDSQGVEQCREMVQNSRDSNAATFCSSWARAMCLHSELTIPECPELNAGVYDERKLMEMVNGDNRRVDYVDVLDGIYGLSCDEPQFEIKKGVIEFYKSENLPERRSLLYVSSTSPNLYGWDDDGISFALEYRKQYHNVILLAMKKTGRGEDVAPLFNGKQVWRRCIAPKS